MMSLCFFFFKLHLLLHEKVCHLMIENYLTIREQHMPFSKYKMYEKKK
jgi:hypothetical protein